MKSQTLIKKDTLPHKNQDKIHYQSFTRVVPSLSSQNYVLKEANL